MSRAKTQKPRNRPATERAATIDRAREERHVMLDRGSKAVVRASRARSESPATVNDTRRAVSENFLDDDPLDLVELAELPRLAVAIHETPPHLLAAQHAIAAAGHAVVKAVGGRGGEAELQLLLSSGELDVLFVGLPAGEALIDAALALGAHRPIVIATGVGPAVEVIHQATLAGADLAVTRPLDAEKLAPVLLAAARLADERRHLAAARANEQLLRERLDHVAAPEPGTLQPFELFQRVLELELKRAKRYLYPIAVALFAVEIPPPPPPAGVRGILRARAGNALIHSIRDIDLATELDHERFLVLLPYTDLAGGGEVARRIIKAVAENDPVVMGGRTFPPRVTGAVAGAMPGQPLSFAKLMRDASRALEQARADGAELAVQP